MPGFLSLLSQTEALSGKPLVMRLMRDDFVKLSAETGQSVVLRVNTIKGSGQILLAPHEQANVDARNRDKEDSFSYTSKTAGSLQKANGRRVTISPIGEVRDRGFPG